MNVESYASGIASESCTPFMHPDDDCYARAHEMCQLMQKQGDQVEWEAFWPNGTTGYDFQLTEHYLKQERGYLQDRCKDLHGGTYGQSRVGAKE
jgi:hypothetical protein